MGMITLHDNDYAAIADKLLAAIGAGEFYNGTVDYDGGSFTAALRTTLLIYREPTLDPADPSRSATRITGIVPVWWEFHTCGESGETPNDFSWNEIKEFIL